MEFNLIDIDKWNRKEYFNHFYKDIPCTYSLTAKLDITNIKNKNLKLYPALIYCITLTVNKYKEFRTAYNSKGQLGYYNKMMPCYTVFNKESELFYNLWTNMQDNINDFITAYNNDILTYGSKNMMNPKPNMPENTFPISMIPWVSFEGFNLNLQKGYDYLLPIFTAGKYSIENEKYIMPLALQVHHGVCDGYHTGRFINTLQEIIDNI